MNRRNPTVSLGLPVYNGENYLGQALESIRSQTYKDWELIISDNASTDASESICRAHAAEDPRVRYFRQRENVGAGPNYNLVFEQATGRYFKWVAHDDHCDDDLVERCVQRLEAEPETVLCHGLLVDTDERGEVLGEYPRGNTHDLDAPSRFRRLIRHDHNCAEIFGVIRTDVLRRSQLIKDYTDSDRTLLAQLSLYGPFAEEPETRFYRRMHSQKSDFLHADFFERSLWFNPRNAERIVLPATSQFLNLARAVLGADLTVRERLRCLRGLAQHTFWMRSVYRREYTWFVRRCFRERSAHAAA